MTANYVSIYIRLVVNYLAATAIIQKLRHINEIGLDKKGGQTYQPCQV